MHQIEPNVIGLLFFSGAWVVCCVGILHLARMYPLSARPDALRSASGVGLIVANSVVLLALLAVTFRYGFAELRWTSLVMVGGLVFLFTPGAFQVVPESWRDGPGGLATLLALLLASLVVLFQIGGVPEITRVARM